MGVTTTRRGIVRLVDGESTQVSDALAVEAPLTIVVDREVLVTTMRTPGHDLELAGGWLVNESAIRRSTDIVTMGAFASRPESDDVDTVRVALAPGVTGPRARAFVTSSACGVCSADVLAAFTGTDAALHSPEWMLPGDVIARLVEAMRDAQRAFDRTGALHAATLVGPDLDALWTREDVGRHNAVDKVIGRALVDDLLPLTDHTLVVSGRVSYEIVHKALTAGIAAIVAVSGPTSLAIDLARAHDLVVVGFARGDRVNVYSGSDRIVSRTHA